jgi:periplasmic protein TonB
MKKIILSLLFVLPLLAIGQVDSIDVSKPETLDEPEIFEFAEMQPEYPGGTDSMRFFIAKNLVYPAKAQKDSVQGTVFVRFVVETNGILSNIKIAKSLSKECDEEVIRVLKLMPTWKPGMNRMKPVRVLISLPIKFRLQ